MQNTGLWLASIFGPLMVIIGLWRLLYSDKLSKVLANVKASPGLLYYSSVVYLWVGFVMLSQFDVWAWNVLSLVTLLGWFLVIRGIVGLFAPQIMYQIYADNPNFVKVCGVIPLVWGLILCWAAFFMTM
jgi:hypothetical protein